MSTSPLRKDIEDLVWNVTDDGYKKVVNGLRMLNFGDRWIPISELPERQLEDRVRTAKAHRNVDTTGNKYITHQPVNLATGMHSRKVTIYAQGGGMYPSFLNGEKASKFLVEIGGYAQYKNAARLYFVPKGKKNVREIVCTQGRHYGRVFLVVLDGWDHPGMETSTPLSSSGSVSVSRGRKEHEIKADIDEYIKTHPKKVLVDLRGHNVEEKTY